MIDNMSDFSDFEIKYAKYLDSISEKHRMAHKVAHDVLGSSYQLQYTIDYTRYEKEMKEKGEALNYDNPKKMKRKNKQIVNKQIEEDEDEYEVLSLNSLDDEKDVEIEEKKDTKIKKLKKEEPSKIKIKKIKRKNIKRKNIKRKENV